MLLFLFCIIILIYQFHVNISKVYWRDKGVVPNFIYFSFWHSLQAYFGQLNKGLAIDQLYKEYPENDAVGFYDVFRAKLLVKNPTLIEKMMASDFSSFHANDSYVTPRILRDPYISDNPLFLQGDKWKIRRNCIIPLLSQMSLKKIYPMLLDVLTRFDECLHFDSPVFEVKNIAMLLTLDTISSCVFGLTSNCFTDLDAPFRKMWDAGKREQIIKDFFGYKYLEKMVGNWLNFMGAIEIGKRRRKTVFREDLLQEMVFNLSDPDCVEQLKTFFTEGFETTSMTSCFAIYELARNCNIQKILFEEIHNSFGFDKDMDFDTLWSLPYLDKVVQETMRKYVVNYVFQRICTKDTILTIDNRNVIIEAGTPVTNSPSSK